VNRRLLGASVGVAVVISLVGGWALSRATGDDASASSSDDDIAVLETPGTAQIPSIETNPKVSGDSLPIVDLITNDGAVVSTADLIGQPLVINFWYSTCAPCKKELPAFADLQREFGDRVRFVGVNPVDTPEVNESFARDRGVQYELLRDPDGEYQSEMKIATAPFTLFVDAEGIIVRQAGVLDEDGLREHLEELLS
jgi:peroxiredoxin